MEKKRPKTSNVKLHELFKAIEKEVSTAGLNINVDRIYELMSKIHETPVDDEKEKLRKKDEEFAKLTVILLNRVRTAAWLPQGTVKLFELVCVLFGMVEMILWELKGIEGPMPDVPKLQPKPSGPSA